MATGTGLDASVGVAPEAAFGTFVAPSRHFLWKSDSLLRAKTTVQGSSFGSGQYDLAARRVVTTRSAKGAVMLDLVDRGMGLLFDQALGASTVTPRAVTGVTDMVFTPAGLRGKSASWQIGRPSSQGPIEPFSYPGGKITDFDLTIAKGGIAELAVALVTQDELTLGTTPAGPALTPPAPSLAGVPFSFLSAALLLNGAPAVGVEKINVKPMTAFNESRFFINSNGLAAEALQNGMRRIEGSIDAEFTTRQAFFDAFALDASLALVLTLTGAPIAATGVNAQLKVEVPVIKLNGGTPPVSGPDVLKHTMPYVGLSDGVNPPIKVTYTTSDSAL